MKFFAVLLVVFVIFVAAEETKYDCSDWKRKLDDEGNVVFIAGDRKFTVPKNIPEIDPLYCSRQYAALDTIKVIAKNCMKPFPRQMVGLATYGSRKEVRDLCRGSQVDKQLMLDNNRCFQKKQNLDHLHQSMDSLILKFETIRDNVSNESLKIPYMCCSLNDFLDGLATDFYKICGDKQIDYWIDLTERKLNDSVDLLCSGYKRGSTNNKCPKFKQDNSLTVPSNKSRQSESIILVIVDILSELSSAPDVDHP